MFEAPQFNDGRGLYPETIKARTWRGTADTLKTMATAEGVSVGEFVRRAIRERVERKAGATQQQEVANG